MKKARIVLDVDEELKKAFKERIEAVNPRYTMTNVLTLYMYEILVSSNEEIKRYFNHALTVEAANQTYKKLVQDAIKRKLLPETFKIGNSRYNEIQTCLVQLYNGDIEEDEALTTLNRLRKEAYLDSSEGLRDKLTQTIND